MAFIKKNKRRIIILLIELLVFLLVYLGIRAWMQRDMVVGQAPALPSITMQGEAFSLESYEGKPVLVHFWASWCGICKLQQGAIDSISQDWQVITIAMQSGNADDVRAHMQEQGLNWPVIIDTTGVVAQSYGVRGVPAMSDYAASKWGLIGLTQSAALDYGADDIRVNVIAPGIIETEKAAEMKAQMPDLFEQLRSDIPLGRFGQMSDIAGLVTWLLSDEARYVTGATIRIDAGQTIG
jgi:thiol-disulfide isomerase/thioredoxin